MQTRIEGAAYVLGDNIDTDQIIPAHYLTYNPSIAAEYKGRVKVGKLDVDANGSTAARFNIRGIPTLLVIKDGQVKEQIVGAVDKSVITKALDKHL